MLVPRLCLGTHCPGGSASRGGASGALRSQAEPGHEGSINLLKPALMNLARAHDEEAQRIEAGQVGMRQDENDIVDIHSLPLVQADQNIAALDAGLGARAPQVVPPDRHASI